MPEGRADEGQAPEGQAPEGQADEAVYAVEVGAGRPVVFLHDVYAAHDSFEEITLDISQDWRCVTVDLPGYGKTSPVGPDASFASIALDLVTALDVFESMPAVLVGHGVGALFALEICRLTAVTGAVLVAPGVVPYPADGSVHLVEDLFVDAYSERFFRDQPGRAAEERVRLASLDVTVAGALHKLMADHATVVTAYAPPGVPTLVIGGMDDRLIRPSLVDDLGRTLGADVEFLRGVGHMAPIEAPGEVSALLRSFLDRF